MYLPTLNSKNTSREMIEEFKGYNHRIRCNENEFYNMKNLSGDNYPVLSTRKKRGLIKKLEQPQGIISKKGITYVDNGCLYVNNELVELKDGDNNVIILSATGEKNLIHMGAYLIILPDKVWVNTENFDAGYIEQINTFNCNNSNRCTIEICDSEGSIYSGINYLSSEPDTTNLADGYKWYDTVTGYLKKWSKATSMWVTVSTVYTKISAIGIGKNIAEGDAVDIDGIHFYPNTDKSPDTDAPIYVLFKGEAYCKSEPKEGSTTLLYTDKQCTNVISETNTPDMFKNINSHMICDLICNTHYYCYDETTQMFKRGNWKTSGYDTTLYDQLETYNTNMLVQKSDKDYLVVVGQIKTVYKQCYGKIEVSRTMPIMDFCIENNNRLWGCRYGTNKNGDIVNEIYASKQGDFKNWFCYAGISTDSYAVTVGSDGAFTGAVSYGQYPYFFKENCIHRIAGAIPSQFQMVTTNCRGIQKGSEKSLAEVDGVLFYKSANDICIFSGSLPSGISDVLGDVAYKNAVGGAIGHKYYVSMLNTEINEYELFVYDISTSLWHKEDNAKIIQFAKIDTDLYYIDDENNLMTTTGTGKKEDCIDWAFESGVIGYSYDNNKYLSKLNVRLNTDISAVVNVYIQYNSSDKWELAGHIKGNNTKSYNIPIKPKRCDHFRIKFVGEGECKLFSIAKYIEIGSDKYV